MFFKSKKVIGLDIGTNSIKMAEISLSRGSATLNSFAHASTPQGAISEGEVANPAAVAGTIRNLIASLKSGRKQVSVGLWGSSVIVKKIAIPQIEMSLVADQVRWEAEQYIPFDINDINLAHKVIPSTAGGETMDILLIAAQKNMIQQYADIIEMAGLTPAVVDVSGFALANCFELNYGVAPGQCIALVNMGAGITNVVVIASGEVIFCRDIPVGGDSFTNEIHKELGVTMEEAEALKLGMSAGSEVPSEVHNVVAAYTESLIDEVRNSFDFFTATNSGFVINQALYTGGGFLMPGLSDQLANQLGVEFLPFDPLSKVKTAKQINLEYLERIRPICAVAIGLAVRSVGDS